MRSKKRRFDWLLACLALGLLVSLSTVTSSALAAPAKSVTIHATEFFDADGSQQITIDATGGVFGAGSSGTAASDQVILGSDTSLLHRAATVYHGIDVYTTNEGDAQGTFTFAWRFTCAYTTDIHSVCSGPWHITGGTGDYQGASGGGKADDQCDDEYNGPDGAYSATTCSDTLVGTIRVP